MFRRLSEFFRFLRRKDDTAFCVSRCDSFFSLLMRALLVDGAIKFTVCRAGEIGGSADFSVFFPVE